MKRIDIQLRRKEEWRDTPCRRGVFFRPRNLTGNNSNYRNKSGYNNYPKTPEESSTKPEPDAYPVIRVQKYRDGPTTEIAVCYERINRIVENKATRNRVQEENVCHARPANLYKRNGGRPRRSTILTRRQQAAATARRVKAGSATSDTPLANNYGLRPKCSPKKPALRGTKHLTFRPSRKKTRCAVMQQSSGDRPCSQKSKERQIPAPPV